MSAFTGFSIATNGTEPTSELAVVFNRKSPVFINGKRYDTANYTEGSLSFRIKNMQNGGHDASMEKEALGVLRTAKATAGQHWHTR